MVSLTRVSNETGDFLLRPSFLLLTFVTLLSTGINIPLPPRRAVPGASSLFLLHTLIRLFMFPFARLPVLCTFMSVLRTLLQCG